MRSQVWRERTVYGSGVAAPVVTLGGCAIASLGYAEPYSMLNQNISDLGAASASAWHLVFNGSMIAGAVLLTIFTVGTSLIVGSRVGYGVAAAALIANIGMALVGLFPSDPETQREHLMAAAVAFIGILCLSASFAVFVRIIEQPYLPRWLVWPAMVNVVCTTLFFGVIGAQQGGLIHKNALWLGPVYWPSALEWSVLLTIMFWSFLVALALRASLKQQRIPLGS
ncbi:MAG: DUF998 domain-containing protein [Candidatus Hydrogenedens sp.]|nr:DUF998 domain-containing protein [Candidatus Hydrogenedens sp.]